MSLVLHWPLDAVTGQAQAADIGPNKLHGTVLGSPQSVADPQVGSCLELDGVNDEINSQAAPAIQLTTYTFELWVRRGTGTNPETAGLLVHRRTDRKGPVWIGIARDGAVVHRWSTATANNDGFRTAAGALPPGEWRHVAITNDGTTARIYINGVEAVAGPVTGALTPNPLGLIVGQYGPGAYLPGRVAHVRAYDHALSALEIQRDIADDEAALESFIRTHPIEFALVNGDQQPVLFIEEGTPSQALTLTLTNRSRRDVEAVALTGTPSATNSHFTVNLRRGTLPANLALKINDAGWAMAAAQDGTAIHLIWKATKALAPGTWVSLRIDGFNADGTDGTRGTSVELAYRKLRYVSDTTELSGTLTQFVDVVNHRGRRDIPLDLRVVGGDRLICDGTATPKLKLQLTNVLREGSGITFTTKSSLRLSFDVQMPKEDRPWALTASGATTTLDAVTGWNAEPQTIGQRMQWTLRPAADTVLAADKFLALTLSNVVALTSMGHAPILVEYIDVPGYANGSLTVSVERTPLVYDTTNVGIGIAKPSAKLQVVGPNSDANGGALIVGAGFLRFGFHGDYAWMQSHGSKPLAINPIGNQVAIGTTTPAAGPKLTVNATGHHLQLRRDASLGGGGNVMYLELFQDQTTGDAVTHPSILFHHSWKFFNRIEGRPNGIHFKFGNTAFDDRVDIHAATAHLTAMQIGATPIWENELKVVRSLTAGTLQLGATTINENDLKALKKLIAQVQVGGTTVNEAELMILKKLAGSSLEFDLYNVLQNEYAYAADYSPFDGDRRYVFTWRRKGERVGQGRWRLSFVS